MKVLDSRVKSSSPVVSLNFRKVQDLYNAIQVLQHHIIEDFDLRIETVYAITSKIAFCEGVLSTFMALETMHLERMEAVVDKLHVLSQENDANEYQRPYELALEILADLPIPYEVVNDDKPSMTDDEADAILHDLACAVLNMQEQARLEETQELPQEITWGNCNCCNAPLNDNHIEWNNEFYCDMVCAEETDGE